MPKPRLLNNADLLEKELSKSSTATLDLKQGVNIYPIENSTIGTLNGMSGSTLVNMLGRVGGMEAFPSLSSGSARVELDSVNKVQGKSALRVTTLLNYTGNGVAFLTARGLTPNAYYIFLLEVNNVTANVALASFDDVPAGNVMTKNKYTTLWAKNRVLSTTASIMMAVNGATENYACFDNLRIYEVSESEYTALDTMTDEQVTAKYPYVDSVQPVRNPYAIRYGENLLPPFYEWGDAVVTGTPIIEGPYRFKMVKASDTVGFSTLAVKVNAAPLTDYTLSIPVEVSNIGGNTAQGVYWNAAAYGADGSVLQDFTLGPFVTDNGIHIMGRTFKTPANTKYVRLVIGMNSPTTGTAVFRDSSLCLGTTAKPFKPREDSMLALQTDLYADPLTGKNADEVFEKDGEYSKLAKWRSELVSGKYTYSSLVLGSGTGWKQVYATDWNRPIPTTNTAFLTKYNGAILTRLESDKTASDQFGIHNTDGYLYITVSNTDSGWGDSYWPTAEEIKAYFMGYKMGYLNGSVFATPYSGTGTKVWRAISGDSGTGSATLPTTQATNMTPYQLLYQLATPVVEPITSEGQLTFFEGDNQIEVGTGIVLRENTRPQISDYGTYINSAFPGFEKTKLKYPTRKILTLFKNGKFDPSWVRNTLDAHGLERAVLSDYDPSAAYSVTYLMWDNCPDANMQIKYPTSLKNSLNAVVEVVGEMKTEIDMLQSDSKYNVKGKGQRIETILYVMPYAVNPKMNSFTDAIFFQQAFSSPPLVFATFDSQINYEGISISVQTVTSTSVVLSVKNLSDWDMPMPGFKIHVLAVG
jgi:hypothetical protein